MLKKVGLEKLSDRKEFDNWLGREFDGKELSGGQWQRLAISGAMAKTHQVLLLDEPTSVSSVSTMSRMFAAIDEDMVSYAIMNWIGAISNTRGIHITIDGKGLRAAVQKKIDIALRGV